MVLASALRRIGTWREAADKLAVVPRTDAEKAALGLGVFSLALGVAELLAPARVARLVGVVDDGNNRALLRAAGLRELAAGVGILTHERPSHWLWGRVGGDVLDLALLANALKSGSARPERTVLATVAVLGMTALDALCARALEEQTQASERPLLESGDIKGQA